MTTAAVMAFLHHVAAFTLVGALMAELALFGAALDLRQARRVQRVDAAYGMSAGVLLVAGLLRVLYFEKGASYYFHNAFFLAKAALFLLVALLSLYPTLLFLSWNKQLKAGGLPRLEEAQVRRVRAVMLVELAGVVGIVFCASLMAREIGMIE